MREVNRTKRQAILEHWYPTLAGFHEYERLNFDDPFCWVCKEYLHHGITTNRKWDDGRLERHHIIPKAIGGSNEPDNLFLMCKRCHDLAPTLGDKDLFVKWARGMSDGIIQESEFRMHIRALCPIQYFEAQLLDWIMHLEQSTLYNLIHDSIDTGVFHRGYYGPKTPRSNLAITFYREWLKAADSEING